MRVEFLCETISEYYSNMSLRLRGKIVFNQAIDHLEMGMLLVLVGHDELSEVQILLTFGIHKLKFHY